MWHDIRESNRVGKRQDEMLVSADMMRRQGGREEERIQLADENQSGENGIEIERYK